MPKYRIHPIMGVARVGDSTDPNGFFIGPEEPGIPGNFVNGSFQKFRDTKGQIKRQAARFRVYEYPDNGSPPVEVAVGARNVTRVEWRVHIANKKGSFFTFNGQSGAETDPPYTARASRPPDAIEKALESDQPERRNLRNHTVADRKSLEIDPGEKVISTVNPGAVPLTNSNANVPFIKDLGELHMDAARLIVLGGHGIAGSNDPKQPPIDEYASNDTWFDDVGDGPVKARIVLSDGTTFFADPAWVLVGPPKFAPALRNVVRLYDTLWDIAVRQLPIPTGNPLYAREPFASLLKQKKAWGANDGKSLDGYTPSFTREIYPILERALGARDVHDPGEINRSYHLELVDYAKLAQPDSGQEKDEPRRLRQYIFSRMRDPRATVVTEDHWKNMPRGLGDDYDALDDFEKKKADAPLPTSFLSLTQVQYAVLEQWAKGNFEPDWKGKPPIPNPGEVTPEGLDLAALENCVGGPFYPGIEVSWLVRQQSLYPEPFRLNAPKTPEDEPGDKPLTIGPLEFGPGYFSQQMAQPWQADFYDCHKESHTTPGKKKYFFMWWTAQRPDDVFPAGGDEQVRWVRQFDDPSKNDDDNEGDIARFDQMQKNWPKLKFLIPAPQGVNHDYEEEPDFNAT
jgi:hypothetical protein